MADKDEWVPVQQIPGLIPFACSYTKDGVWYCITLYGADEESVLENNCGELENLRIDGIMDSTLEVDDEEMRRYGG